MYKPNFNDPRVLRKATSAFGFVVAHLSDTEQRPVYCKHIEEHLGRSNNKLGSWLRSKVLICTNNYYNKDRGIMKKYIYNKVGLNILSEALNIPLFEYKPDWNVSKSKQRELHYRSYAITFCESKFSDELITQDFNYTLRSNRYWHPLQSVRSQTRSALLHKYGFKYNYDIVACAPNLLYQRYLQANRHVVKLNMSHLEQLLEDRAGVRNMVSNSTGVELKHIKTVLTALFCSAKLSANTDCALFNLINQDYKLMANLQSNEYITGLKADISKMWDGIRHGLPKHQKAYRADGKPASIDANIKWAVYFDMERQVMESAQDYMNQLNIKTFKIHDCFVTNKKINTTQLEQHIKQQTGYKLTLELSS